MGEAEKRHRTSPTGLKGIEPPVPTHLPFRMAAARLLRPSAQCLKAVRPTRQYTSAATPQTSPFAPRHLLSIADLTPQELTQLVRNAASHKAAVKSGGVTSLPKHLQSSLLGQTLAVMFTKRSTRTRVSTEGAITMLGGHTMFLGSGDIQLGVNESLYDTSVVISALSDSYHPLQTIADFLTIHEAFQTAQTDSKQTLGLEGLKIAWVGDANNVLFDLAIGAGKLGCELSVATPKGYEIPKDMLQTIHSTAPSSNASFQIQEINVPEEAVKNADIIVTDTWISMGQESEKQQRLKDFEGFQITAELAKRGGAKEGWKFMHCLPRKPEEVSDEVFYSPASLVFQEAENRLWSAVAALEGFVVNKGKIV